MTRTSYKPRTNIAALLALTLAVTTILANVGAVYAATLTSASLNLSDSRISATSDYTFTASGFSTGGNTIGCIEVDLGTAANGTGDTGANISGTTLGSQTITATGTWTENSVDVDDKLRVTNASPVAAQSGAQSISFTNIVNGSTANTAYYAVVTTYTTDACSTPVDSVTVQFIYTNGQSVTAQVDGTLTFAVNTVASGQLVKTGITTTAASTTTSLPFGTITDGTNGIVAQDLAVATNAGNGYTVYIRSDGALRNAGHSIADQAGSNASPTAFNAGEGFGYTTNDLTLGTGTASRFTGDVWAPFDTNNFEVAFSAAETVEETTRVGVQTGITSTTPSGSYAAQVIYTATPVY